jgi:hypothetical protein
MNLSIEFGNPSRAWHHVIHKTFSLFNLSKPGGKYFNIDRSKRYNSSNVVNYSTKFGNLSSSLKLWIYRLFNFVIYPNVIGKCLVDQSCLVLGFALNGDIDSFFKPSKFIKNSNIISTTFMILGCSVKVGNISIDIQ